jgi:hypothetical protein
MRQSGARGPRFLHFLDNRDLRFKLSSIAVGAHLPGIALSQHERQR